MWQNNYEYDAFISHAVEDKIPIANELCAKLERAGLKIWYSGKELGIGDSIEKTIQKGLNRSRYGIVIFSPTYLAKNWTIREFYTLLAKEIEERKVILPVLYNVTLDDLKNKDLVMADRFAVDSDKGIDHVVERLVGEIKKSYAVEPQSTWFAKLWFFFILSLLANVIFLFQGAFFRDEASGIAHKAQSFRSAETLPYSQAINHKTFLGEVQGMFSQLSACQCGLRGRDQPENHIYQARYDQGNDIFLKRNEGGYYDSGIEGAPAPVRPQSPVRKMTMALVFQMETLADMPLEQEMGNLLSTVALNEPFLTVTNQEKERNAAKIKGSHASCLNN